MPPSRGGDKVAFLSVGAEPVKLAASRDIGIWV